ncbi:MAG: MBL fold metallo-hydrolase [Elusimicrobiota bacterium]
MRTQAILLCCALLGAAVPIRAKEVQSGGQVLFEVRKLAEGVYAAVTPEPRTPAVSNSAFIELSDSVLVVDSHKTPEAAKALLKEIGKITKKPVRYLVYTHSHGDHVGGASAFPEGTEIIAHVRTRQSLLRKDPPAVPPSAVIRDGITLIRGREVQIRFPGKAHTDDNLYVWLPKEKILIAGDLLFNGSIGYMKEAYVWQWAQALGQLSALAPGTVVPGHGPLTDAEGIERFRRFLTDFQAAVKKHKDRGDSLEKAIETFELPDPYGSWGMQAVLEDDIRRVWSQTD